MIAVCSSCQSNLSSDQHIKECAVLKQLRLTVGNNVDSVHFLAVRLLCAHDMTTVESFNLWECLYESDGQQIDSNSIALICNHLPAPANDAQQYKKCLARVIGCSHNIADVSLPLGKQSLGRAMFLEHSFYNHSCKPNTFLSSFFCSQDNMDIDKRNTVKISSIPTPLKANLHLLRQVKQGEPITISYISMSGLSLQERQHRLKEGYGFYCNCCMYISDDDDDLQPKIPLNMDVESIREIQFSCNDQFMHAKENDEIEHIISLARMTQRGIENQKIPQTHEGSIESDRLLAMTYTSLEQWNNAKEHHERFLCKVNTISDLFDPVAMATQYLEYSQVLNKTSERDNAKQIWTKAIDLLETSLGKDHPWVRKKGIFKVPKSETF
jgi:hypothetical protein